MEKVKVKVKLGWVKPAEKSYRGVQFGNPRSGPSSCTTTHRRAKLGCTWGLNTVARLERDATPKVPSHIDPVVTCSPYT